jgi:DNA invertase Pin-like site-specific DNA recombinase
MVEVFSKLDIALHLVDFGGNSINTSSAVGKMFLTMLAGFAEFERNLIGERTKAALDVKKERGERVGHIPFGKMLGKDGKTLVDDPFEQDTIDAIRGFRLAGMSVSGIMKLEMLSTDVWLNRGKPWTKSSLYRLMEREGIE